MNIQTIRLDVSKRPAVAQVVRIGQCDSSGTTIVAQVYDNGAAADLAGMTAMFEMRLPDGRSYVRDANCAVSGNEIAYVVDEGHCASVPGVTDEAYFDILDGPSVVYSTGRFRVVVEGSAHADGVPAESWDNAIDGLIRRGEDFMDDVERNGVPLMAASVRGGARLGGGLRVGDGALSVDPVTDAQVDSVAAGAAVSGPQVLDATGLTRLWSRIKAAFAAVTHSHAAGDITSGSLAVARGGTGAATADAARANLDAAQSEGASGSLADAEQAIADIAADVATLGESVSQRPVIRRYRGSNAPNLVQTGQAWLVLASSSVESSSLVALVSRVGGTVTRLVLAEDAKMELIYNAYGTVNVSYDGSNDSVSVMAVRVV